MVIILKDKNVLKVNEIYTLSNKETPIAVARNYKGTYNQSISIPPNYTVFIRPEQNELMIFKERIENTTSKIKDHLIFKKKIGIFSKLKAESIDFSMFIIRPQNNRDTIHYAYRLPDDSRKLEYKVKEGQIFKFQLTNISYSFIILDQEDVVYEYLSHVNMDMVYLKDIKDYVLNRAKKVIEKAVLLELSETLKNTATLSMTDTSKLVTEAEASMVDKINRVLKDNRIQIELESIEIKYNEDDPEKEHFKNIINAKTISGKES